MCRLLCLATDTTKRRSASTALFLLGLAALAAPAATTTDPPDLRGGGATLEVSASEALVNPGETVEITVSITGLGDAAPPSLGTYDLSLVFDPAVFAYEMGSLEPTDFLGDGDLAEALYTVSAGAGDVEVVALSLLTPMQLTALQAGSFELFTATFTAIGFGDGVFDLVANGPLGDENGSEIALAGVVPVTVSGGSVIDIPTSGSVGLALMTLLLLAGGVLVLRRAV
ncbi:MAG: hypothetical protein DWQ36_20570 [Acidobacteria bacterium]|nr:MAG: hypothetical protein DWQ30_20995 [Acidobacteriota bacterium]REK03265.1 MAG: hypothetical protein DWQ36_20570 [Acidobacteriota bacterium]